MKVGREELRFETTGRVVRVNAGFVGISPAGVLLDGAHSWEEFKANGEAGLRIYREVAALGPSERMLDLGCGTGIKTWPLVSYFTPQASYTGLDIQRESVEWCRSRYTPRFPNFRFLQADVFNRYYNPAGKYQPADYRLPFADASL